MADIVYFGGELTSGGEVKLIKHDVHIDYDSAPQRVQVVVQDMRVPYADPTLTVFYAPQELKKDDK